MSERTTRMALSMALGAALGAILGIIWSGGLSSSMWPFGLAGAVIALVIAAFVRNRTR